MHIPAAGTASYLSAGPYLANLFLDFVICFVDILTPNQRRREIYSILYSTEASAVQQISSLLRYGIRERSRRYVPLYQALAVEAAHHPRRVLPGAINFLLDFFRADPAATFEDNAEGFQLRAAQLFFLQSILRQFVRWGYARNYFRVIGLYY